MSCLHWLRQFATTTQHTQKKIQVVWMRNCHKNPHASILGCVLQIASEPTQALRQMLNVGGGDRSGARLGYAAPALQQWQGGAADVEATGEALRDMLHIRGGASGSTAVRVRDSSGSARDRSAHICIM